MLFINVVELMLICIIVLLYIYIFVLLGKRSCPGESLAQMEIFLFVTCLVQKYNIILAEENSFEEVLGLTLQPKQAVHLRFIKRIPYSEQ